MYKVIAVYREVHNSPQSKINPELPEEVSIVSNQETPMDYSIVKSEENEKKHDGTYLQEVTDGIRISQSVLMRQKGAHEQGEGDNAQKAEQ